MVIKYHSGSTQAALPRHYVALGGGGGSFGLYLEDDFSRGTTGSCETFQNAPLCSQEDFDVSTMELWGFGV